MNEYRVWYKVDGEIDYIDVGADSEKEAREWAYGVIDGYIIEVEG